MIDSNQLVFDMGRREVLPRVRETPVIAGVGGVDVLRDMRLYLEDWTKHIGLFRRAQLSYGGVV